MYALVVRSVRIQRNRISVDGKYKEDHHELISAGKLYGMQLDAIVLSHQHVRLRDPNKRLVGYNFAIVVWQ
jgi:hypothetical protein